MVRAARGGVGSGRGRPGGGVPAKVRLIGRGFASVWHRRCLLDPRRTGFYAAQLVTHKVLRRLVGLPHRGARRRGADARRGPSVLSASGDLQFLFHGLALAGFALRRRRLARAAVFSLPLAFDAANLAGLVALVRFLRGENQQRWVPDRRAARPLNTATSSTSPENA